MSFSAQPAHGASPVSMRRLGNDAAFERLFHSSEALRQACGFDSELFDATQSLARTAQVDRRNSSSRCRS